MDVLRFPSVDTPAIDDDILAPSFLVLLRVIDEVSLKRPPPPAAACVSVARCVCRFAGVAYRETGLSAPRRGDR